MRLLENLRGSRIWVKKTSSFSGVCCKGYDAAHPGKLTCIPYSNPNIDWEMGIELKIISVWVMCQNLIYIFSLLIWMSFDRWHNVVDVLQYESVCVPYGHVLCKITSDKCHKIIGFFSSVPVHEIEGWICVWMPFDKLKQEYGRSPVWILLCPSRLCFFGNDFWQMSQENGFSPVCDLMCSLRWPAWLKPFWQNLHECR